ncbi:MAG: protein kinase [Verrucomicrobiales bacterium]|nr:protein kinase [Verrucomicrobiales bacterium]
MNLPGEAHWCRVEEIAAELDRLPPDQAAARLAELEAEGEPRSVLTLLEAWRSLPAHTAPALQPGAKLGHRYTLKERLGAGGMGVVWRAQQDTVEREVAVKLIHPAFVSPALSRRFHDEVRVLGQLDHPGIVRIFDAGIHSDGATPAIPYYVMELVEGTPLSRWAEAHRGDLHALLNAMAAVCDAVQSAHDRRIVHRDLKPANILIRRDGRPVVLDFGIARLVGREEAEEMSGFIGTPQYAAPEQFNGRDRDFRSGESVDVYALGAVLFEMLTGRRLVETPPEATFADLRRTILEVPPPRLASVLPDTPAELDEILTQATRRDPAERFYSVASLGRALSRVASGWSTARDRAQGSAPRWTPAVGALVPGTRWRLTQKLGEGGTGEVWAGVHLDLGERRVFKFCSSEEKARTLKREFTLFRLLKERIGRNPHFVQLHEVSLDEPPWYLMMDDQEAQDLASWVESHPGGLSSIPLEVRLEVIAQAAEALQSAHEAGILHRDVKPANLLVRRGDQESASTSLHVIIADFGLGQLLVDHLHAGVQRYGFTRSVSGLQRTELAGTLMYLAPEVLEGQPATARSDLYSLGVVLWQMTVGNLNAALDPAEWASRVGEPLLRDDLQRCLAGAPERRWSSAGELAASLRAFPTRREAERQRRDELTAREKAAYRRGVIRTALLAGCILALLGGIGSYAWLQSRQVARANAEAERLELSESVGRLEGLVRNPGLGNLRTARAILAQLSATKPRPDGDRRSLADAYVRLLESPDWEVESRTPASRIANPVIRAVGDPASGSILQWTGDAVELLSPKHGRLSVPMPSFPDSQPLLALAPHTQLGAVATNRVVRILGGTTAPTNGCLTFPARVSALAWSPEGTLLAVGRALEGPSFPVGLGVIELRDATGSGPGLLLQRTNAFPYSRAPDGLAFSADGTLLLDWNQGSLHVHVWDVESGALVASAYHTEGVRTAAWISDSEFVTAPSGGRLHRWRIPRDRAELLILDEPQARYPALASAQDGQARIWNRLALTAAGDFALALDEAGRLFAFDLSTGAPAARMPGESVLVSLWPEPAGGVVLYSAEGGIRVAARRASQVCFQATFPLVGAVEDFDVSPDGLRFACGGMGALALFERGTPPRYQLGATSRTKGVRFLDPDRVLVSSRFTNQVVIWASQPSVENATPDPWMREIAQERQEAGYRIAMHTAGDRAALARAGSVQVCSRRAGSRQAVLEAGRGSAQVNGMEFSPDGAQLAWVDQRSDAYLWGGAEGVARFLADRAQSVAWFNSRWCCIAGRDRGAWALEILESPSSTPAKRHILLRGALELAIAQDGRLAAAVMEDGIHLGTIEEVDGMLAWRHGVTLGTTQGGAYSRVRFAGGDRWLGAIAEGRQLHFWSVPELLHHLDQAGCLPDGLRPQKTFASHVPPRRGSTP